MHSVPSAQCLSTGVRMEMLLLGLQVPQYVRNYKTKSADALSPWFLASWLLVST